MPVAELKLPTTPPNMPRIKKPWLTGIARFIFRRIGWRVSGEMPDEKQLLIAAAPHTSNWDFIVAIITMLALDMKTSTMMKKEVFRWPLAGFWRYLGFVPIDRQDAKGIVEQCADYFRENENFWLLITPEGTRSKVKRWKSGFLRIAHAADLPIVLVSIDWDNLELTFGRCFRSTGEYESELDDIVDYFSHYPGKNS